MASIGIDCEDIETFRLHDLGNSARFYERIFTENEVAHCAARPDPYPHLAARFAAKEAVIKAMRPRLVLHKQVEVLNRDDGSPFVRILLDDPALSGLNIQVSLSHSKTLSVACAMVE